jgi:hypothetical protein
MVLGPQPECDRRNSTTLASRAGAIRWGLLSGLEVLSTMTGHAVTRRAPEPRPRSVVQVPEPEWKACSGTSHSNVTDQRRTKSSDQPVGNTVSGPQKAS